MSAHVDIRRPQTRALEGEPVPQVQVGGTEQVAGIRITDHVMWSITLIERVHRNEDRAGSHTVEELANPYIEATACVDSEGQA